MSYDDIMIYEDIKKSALPDWSMNIHIRIPDLNKTFFLHDSQTNHSSFLPWFTVTGSTSLQLEVAFLQHVQDKFHFHNIHTFQGLVVKRKPDVI